jgi:galactokinase
MVDLAINLPGIHGARMTGGGFGGCTINLVEKEFVDEFKLLISERYKEASHINPEIHVTWAADGAAIET